VEHLGRQTTLMVQTEITVSLMQIKFEDQPEEEEIVTVRTELVVPQRTVLE
jgi:hypothetical protein